MKLTNTSNSRNTFKAYYFENELLTNTFNFPVLDSVQRQKIDYVLPFNIFKSVRDNDCWVHFFIDDYQFERIWANPTQYIRLLKRAKGVITTDFSMYTDMPKALQIYNCYRNRAVARYFQKEGINIIPAVGWSDKESFNWCFDGILKGSAVAVSSNGCLNKQSKINFLEGFNKMIDVLDPCQIVFIGKVPEELQNDKRINQFANYSEVFANLKEV